MRGGPSAPPRPGPALLQLLQRDLLDIRVLADTGEVLVDVRRTRDWCGVSGSAVLEVLRPVGGRRLEVDAKVALVTADGAAHQVGGVLRQTVGAGVAFPDFLEVL